MYNFAVVVTYSFSDQVSVLLFRTYEEALEFVKSDVEEEHQIDIFNDWDSEYVIDEDNGRATVTTNFGDHEVGVTEWKIGTVYDPSELYTILRR